MAERESLSAQTERLAALLSKRRGAGAAAVGTAPKVETAPSPKPVLMAEPAPAPKPAPVAPPPPMFAAAPEPAPAPPPIAAPAPVAAPAAPTGSGGDSLSMYFKALGLEDPFSGSDAGASASIEDLLSMQGGSASPAAAPLAPPPPVAPAPPPAPPAPDLVFHPPEPKAAAPAPAPVVVPPAPPPPPPEPEPAAEPEVFEASRSGPAIALGAAEPPKAAAPLHEDLGDFLDQVSFDDPAYPHLEPARSAAPSPHGSLHAAAQALHGGPSAPAPEPEPLDDPKFWEASAEAEEAAEFAASVEEPESLSVGFAAEAEAARHAEEAERAPQPESAEADFAGSDSEADSAYADAEAEDYADREIPQLAEGEMLMPIDAQRAEMIRQLAESMGCAPEDVVVTALDWYLDALMNAEQNPDSDAA